MAKKPPRKPTGQIKTGYLEVGNGAAELMPVETFKLPEVKNDAEDVVMQKFVGVSQQTNNLGLVPRLVSATHLPTDHGPDFDVVREDGSAGYFELCEIAPLTGPYEDANKVMLIGDLVHFVENRVADKVANYGDQPAYRPISLLLYVSHYAFEPGPIEAQCIQATLQKLKTDVFEAIYLELFAHDGNPFVVKLWPVQGHVFTTSQLTGHLRRQMVRPDPSLARILADNSDANQFDVVVRQVMPAGVDLSRLKIGPLSDADAAALGIATRVRVRE